jgi:hypothetical protein
MIRLFIIIVLATMFGKKCIAAPHYPAAWQQDSAAVGSLLIASRGAGWGLSHIEGDATRGRDEGELLLSAFYSTPLMAHLGMEIAVHYCGTQRFFEFRGRPSRDSSRYISVFWIADATLFGRPFSQGILHSLFLGIGPSLRWLTYLDGPNQRSIGPITYTVANFYEEFLLGCNIKADYTMLTNNIFDLYVRGQVHIFFIPLFTSSDSPMRPNGAPGGSASIGAFLRLKF